MRVLLIEDESATAQSIELMLKSENFNVYTTDFGEEGIDLGKLYDYDIILFDLNLPDISGYEVLRTLRAAKVKTPILILSGLAAIEDKVKGLGFGADDYLTKPFHKDELVARIQAIVRRSNGHAQSIISTGETGSELADQIEPTRVAPNHLGEAYPRLRGAAAGQNSPAEGFFVERCHPCSVFRRHFKVNNGTHCGHDGLTGVRRLSALA
jgi:two-component system, cell cycle response regulator CtrA